MHPKIRAFPSEQFYEGQMAVGQNWVSTFGFIVAVLRADIMRSNVDDPPAYFYSFATATVEESSTKSPQNLRDLKSLWHRFLRDLPQPAT